MRTNADLYFEITAADMASLEAVESLDNYGDATMLPVYGGKLHADGILTARR